jgi:uncharacterized membrane protein
MALDFSRRRHTKRHISGCTTKSEVEKSTLREHTIYIQVAVFGSQMSFVFLFVLLLLSEKQHEVVYGAVRSESWSLKD